MEWNALWSSIVCGKDGKEARIPSQAGDGASEEAGVMKGPCKEYGQQLCGCDQRVLGSQRGKLQADND